MVEPNRISSADVVSRRRDLACVLIFVRKPAPPPEEETGEWRYRLLGLLLMLMSAGFACWLVYWIIFGRT